MNDDSDRRWVIGYYRGQERTGIGRHQNGLASLGKGSNDFVQQSLTLFSLLRVTATLA